MPSKIGEAELLTKLKLDEAVEGIKEKMDDYEYKPPEIVTSPKSEEILTEEKFDKAVEHLKSWKNVGFHTSPEPVPDLKEIEKEHEEYYDKMKKTAFKPDLEGFEMVFKEPFNKNNNEENTNEIVNAEKAVKSITKDTGNLYSEIKNELGKRFETFEKGLLFGDWEDYSKYIKEENNMNNFYNLYEITVVKKDVEENESDYPEIIIDERVIAKSNEEAKGKAGVYDALEKEGYDESKFDIRSEIKMLNIKKAKDE